jgi:hypothetical protein
MTISTLELRAPHDPPSPPLGKVRPQANLDRIAFKFTRTTTDEYF